MEIALTIALVLAVGAAGACFGQWQGQVKTTQAWKSAYDNLRADARGGDAPQAANQSSFRSNVPAVRGAQ